MLDFGALLGGASARPVSATFSCLSDLATNSTNITNIKAACLCKTSAFQGLGRLFSVPILNLEVGKLSLSDRNLLLA
jgi:hypothetical protein